MGSAQDGPNGCTCWEPIFDSEQLPVQEGPMVMRPKCCHDCAYRVGSPERADEGFYEFGGLHEIAVSPRSVFTCHQGVRRVVGWRHPVLGELPPDVVGQGDYRPPVGDGRVWLADGRPGELCAGWAAVGGRR